MITNNQTIAILAICFGLVVLGALLGCCIGWWLSRDTKREDPS